MKLVLLWQYHYVALLEDLHPIPLDLVFSPSSSFSSTPGAIY